MKNLPGNRKFEKSMAKEWNHVMIADENISYHGGLEQEAIRTMRYAAGMELERIKQLLR